MKKRTWAALACSLLCLPVLLLSGCGKTETNLNVQEAADKIKSAVTFQDTMTALPDASFDRTYSIDAGDLKSKAVYVSSGATAEEIAVIEATDEAAAKKVKAAVDQRIADQKESFKDYVPAELTKLNDPVVEASGRYVLMCVCDQPEQARQAIKDLLA